MHFLQQNPESSLGHSCKWVQYIEASLRAQAARLHKHAILCFRASLLACLLAGCSTVPPVVPPRLQQCIRKLPPRLGSMATTQAEALHINTIESHRKIVTALTHNENEAGRALDNGHSYIFTNITSHKSRKMATVNPRIDEQ